MADSSYQMVMETLRRLSIEDDGGNCKFIDWIGYSIK